MDCWIVVMVGQVGFVKVCLNDFVGEMVQCFIVVCSGKGYDFVVIGWNCCLVEVDVVKIVVQFVMVVYCFILLQEVDVILGNKDFIWVQVVFVVFIKS